MHIVPLKTPVLHETFFWQINRNGYVNMGKYGQEIAESHTDLPVKQIASLDLCPFRTVFQVSDNTLGKVKNICEHIFFGSSH